MPTPPSVLRSRRAAAAALWSSLFLAAPGRAADARSRVVPDPAAVAASVGPVRSRLPLRGLYVQIEERGAQAGYFSGDLIHRLDEVEPALGHSVADEAALQLDAMAGMGVNVITFELRAADATGDPAGFVPPACNIPPALGFQWPHPTAAELANLKRFFDLVASRGIRIFLRLVNTHMEEDPPTNSAAWLGAILGAVKDHPALELVLFDGDAHLVDSNGDGHPDACGFPAEPTLHLGPASAPGRYVEWAISFARSLGLPARKLSAEEVADLNIENDPPNPPPGSGLAWSPVATMKAIFDDLAIPDAERTYALSFYEHHKCLGNIVPCEDEAPHAWAEETLQRIFAIIGTGSRGGIAANGPRVVAPEMGLLGPVPADWSVEHALESLVFLMEKYGVEGGSLWRWTNFTNAEDGDPTLPDAVKRRGIAFDYNPVEREVLDMGGRHLSKVPNGSFEAGADQPDLWAVSGSGTGNRYFLAGEPGEPEVPSRGHYDLRLTTGSGTHDAIFAVSAPIAVAAGAEYTTTFDLRFGWTGDPNPLADPASRPQVFLAFLYFDAQGRPSAIRAQDTFRFFQEDAPQAFGTFPVRYTPPSDARSVEVEVGAARNGLASPITVDADDVR